MFYYPEDGSIRWSGRLADYQTTRSPIPEHIILHILVCFSFKIHQVSNSSCYCKTRFVCRVCKTGVSVNVGPSNEEFRSLASITSTSTFSQRLHNNTKFGIQNSTAREIRESCPSTHEDVWGKRCIDPHITDRGTSYM